MAALDLLLGARVNASAPSSTPTAMRDAARYVVRMHPDGTWAWAARAGGPDADRACAGGTLADGDAIVGGHFSERPTFDTVTGNAFVARIDTSFVW